MELHTLPANRNKRSVPRVVYSGGIQKWQNINQTLDFIIALKDSIEFSLAILDPEKTRQRLIESGFNSDLVINAVKVVDTEEMRRIYLQSNYGICFRDDSVVNRVACPTKIIEYLEFDIVPILTFSEVGDFKSHGMKFLTMDGVLKDGFPTEKNRKAMVEHNRQVLKDLMKLTLHGEAALRKVINA
jgi:hypothetical protein